MSGRNVIEVFTNKSKELMFDYGGSASWVIANSSGTRLEYCVCCRNDEWPPREEDDGERPELRNEAFFVGKVSGIEFVARVNERNRYLIKFSEYAEVSVPDFRPAGLRNPVMYSDTEDCRRRGLDIANLEFKPMPTPTQQYERRPATKTETSVQKSGLTIAQAKEGLAIHFDVPIDAVQITISG